MSEVDQRISNEVLMALGFHKLPQFTVGNSLHYQLGRGRYLSVMCIGLGNESMWICSEEEQGQVSDLVCLHNRDYDGFITVEKIKTLIEWFCGGSQKVLRGGDQNTKNKAQSIENTGHEGGDQKALRGEHE